MKLTRTSLMILKARNISNIPLNSNDIERIVNPLAQRWYKCFITPSPNLKLIIDFMKRDTFITMLSNKCPQFRLLCAPFLNHGQNLLLIALLAYLLKIGHEQRGIFLRTICTIITFSINCTACIQLSFLYMLLDIEIRLQHVITCSISRK